MSKLARRHRKRKFKKNPSSAPKRNPPLTSDLLEWVVPGFAGFVGTRLLTRLALALIGKRFPQYAKHGGAIASVSSFLSAWFLGDRVKLIAKYHTPITVGSAIAAAQSILQIYAPNKLGWMVSDASSQVAARAVARPQQQALPDHMEEISDPPSWYTYNDAYDSGRYSGSLGKAPPQEQVSPTPQESVPIDEPQDGDDQLAAGIFGN